MQKYTYVAESLKNGKIMRWTFMPLKVFIAPMKFYSKQGEEYKYSQLVCVLLMNGKRQVKAE